MRRVIVAFLVLGACFASDAWAHKITCPARVNWSEFLTIDMARYNPCKLCLASTMSGISPALEDFLWQHGGLARPGEWGGLWRLGQRPTGRPACQNRRPAVENRA